MSALTEKANELKRSLPRNGQGAPPAMKGQLLGELPHKDGKIVVSWDEYEGHSFLSIRLWTSDDGKSYWPSKIGFTIRIKDLPDFAVGIQTALDMALDESKKQNPPRKEDSRGFTEGTAPF